MNPASLEFSQPFFMISLSITMQLLFKSSICFNRLFSESLNVACEAGVLLGLTAISILTRQSIALDSTFRRCTFVSQIVDRYFPWRSCFFHAPKPISAAAAASSPAMPPNKEPSAERASDSTSLLKLLEVMKPNNMAVVMSMIRQEMKPIL